MGGVGYVVLWGEECTNGRDGGDDLAQLQLVQDGRLSGRVQADHQDTHLLLAPEAIEQLRECETHLGGCRVGVVELWREMQGDQQMVPGSLLAKGSHSITTPLAALIYAVSAESICLAGERAAHTCPLRRPSADIWHRRNFGGHMSSWLIEARHPHHPQAPQFR